MAATVPATVTEDAWHARWEAALQALELDVDAAEALLRTAHLPDVGEVARVATWAPPAAMGPLPVALHDRARALLDRQLDVARRTAEAAALSRRHLGAAQAMRARPAASPVYVDVQG